MIIRRSPVCRPNLLASFLGAVPNSPGGTAAISPRRKPWENGCPTAEKPRQGRQRAYYPNPVSRSLPPLPGLETSCPFVPRLTPWANCCRHYRGYRKLPTDCSIQPPFYHTAWIGSQQQKQPSNDRDVCGRKSSRLNHSTTTKPHWTDKRRCEAKWS